MLMMRRSTSSWHRATGSPSLATGDGPGSDRWSPLGGSSLQLDIYNAAWRGRYGGGGGALYHSTIARQDVCGQGVRNN